MVGSLFISQNTLSKFCLRNAGYLLPNVEACLLATTAGSSPGEIGMNETLIVFDKTDYHFSLKFPVVFQAYYKVFGYRATRFTRIPSISSCCHGFMR